MRIEYTRAAGVDSPESLGYGSLFSDADGDIYLVLVSGEFVLLTSGVVFTAEGIKKFGPFHPRNGKLVMED